jgi:hypothetical protein
MGLGQFLSSQAPGGLSSYLNQLTQPTNPLGQIGKAVSQASGGAWGNALSLLDQQKRQQEQDGMQSQIQKAQLEAMTAKQNRNQIVQLPNGGIAAVDPDTNQIEMLRDPEAHKSSAQENFEYFKGLPEGDKPQFRQLLPNFNYTPEGISARTQGAAAIADVQGAARAKYRVPGGTRGSGGVTPTKRADLVGQAQQAIARGADPAKVHARLAQMGVNF